MDDEKEEEEDEFLGELKTNSSSEIEGRVFL